VLMSVAGGQ